jgi:hypothetical protein
MDGKTKTRTCICLNRPGRVRYELAVTGEEAVHHATDRLVEHLGEEVNVIGHQAVRVEIEGPPGFL